MGKTAPCKRVGCNGWLGLCDFADEQRSNARVRSRRKLLTRTLNQTAPKTCGAIARAPRERSNAGNDNASACAPSFFFAPKTKHASGKLYSFLARESTTRSFTPRLLVFPTISGQPRRAGDSKFETDPFEALRCSGWFGFFFETMLTAFDPSSVMR